MESYTDTETSEVIYQEDEFDCATGGAATNQDGYVWMVDDTHNTSTVNWSDGASGTASWKAHDEFTSNARDLTYAGGVWPAPVGTITRPTAPDDSDAFPFWPDTYTK